ncbi:unnamed protein product [Vitrella brassicaformis CCMP3155]|uniref:Uncharacterized protein n=1 Tax=Vitrella brassicaformis (strain CCMP3155) TaxID=1169540 RepID=A0A0G4EEV0_VITBC|nr:unnamed protein product [Vitrella brassicaformis CCMP3155]|eukprot:CEL93935.1 unnamed protein product [Vitrella brassicaformis CCMP3155]
MAARQAAAQQQQEVAAEPPMDEPDGDEPDDEDNEEGGGGVMANGSESGGHTCVQDDSDDGGMLDEDLDQDDDDGDSEGDDGSESGSDGHDDGYEDDGHSVVPITSVDVPSGFLGVNEIEARFPLGTNETTKELGLGVIGRTISAPQHVTDLIEQGADPNVGPMLRQKGSKHRGDLSSLVHLAIDNKSDYTVKTIQAEADDACRPVALPHWSSDELQRAIIATPLDGGADPNAAADETEQTPLHLAIASGNQTAFDTLTAPRQDVDLRPPDAPMVMELPRPLRQPPTEYLRLLMSMYRRLIERDPTLATERDVWGTNLVHHAAMNARGHYPQSFIVGYLDLITQLGADMTAADGNGWTLLRWAAEWGSPKVADYLCRKLPADQVNRRDNQGQTPLAKAAEELDHNIQRLQHPNTPEADKERHRAKIDNLKLTIHSLLRAGADISSTPTDTEEDRHQRQLVLTEYATVLNELPAGVMAAVNAALAPHRSLAALLIPRLVVGPQEAAIFGWRIASYLFDMNAAQEAISEAIGVRHTDMARRVCAAAEHFVKSAVYQASSNREVVGGTRYEQQGDKRFKVTVPQLQCFMLEGVDSRPSEAVHTRGRVGLREVVHRAVLDEAAKWGVQGVVVKGFNTHLGDADCQFTWQQLGAALQQSTTPPPATPAPASTQQPTPSTQQPTPPPAAAAAAASGCEDAVDGDKDSWEEVSGDDEMDDEVEE